MLRIQFFSRIFHCIGSYWLSKPAAMSWWGCADHHDVQLRVKLNCKERSSTWLSWRFSKPPYHGAQLRWNSQFGTYPDCQHFLWEKTGTPGITQNVRALTDPLSVMSEFAPRNESTISEVKGACPDDCATLTMFILRIESKLKLVTSSFTGF
jgi:hypothetical protein